MAAELALLELRGLLFEREEFTFFLSGFVLRFFASEAKFFQDVMSGLCDLGEKV